MAYVLLALAGLLPAAYLLRRSAHPARLVILFVVAASLVALADWIAFGWFQLYSYRPHLAASPMADSSLGELLADILFVPSLAVITAELLPAAAGAVLGTFTLTGLEYLLLRAGLFLHQGWRVWYTIAAFPWYFLLLDRFFRWVAGRGVCDQLVRRVTRIGLLFCAAVGLTLLLRGLQVVHTNLAVMPTHMGNQSLGRFLTYVPPFLLLGYWVMTGARYERWWRLGATTLLFWLLNLTFSALRFQLFMPPYSTWLDALAQGASLSAACLADDWIVRHGSPVRT